MEKDSICEKLLNDFVKEGHEYQSKAIVTLLSITTFKESFVKSAPAITSSGAEKNLFSLEKDVLHSKQSGLSHKHFETLVCIK